MTEEQWAELLKLRAKARLTPKTDYRYSRLEEFLSAQNYLSTYTPEERKSLLEQFNELSNEEKLDLVTRATRKTNPAFFHLTYQEIETLQASWKELPFHERARLFSDPIHTAAGTAWLDLGNVLEAVIEVDDDSTPERETRPCAHIYFSDGYRRRVETIDIQESIRSNPASIGHPAIVFAIYHWQRIIYAKRVLERDDITSRDELGKAFKAVFGGGREVRIAERNLLSISKLLYEGAKERAIPKESALALNMQLLGLRLEDKNTVFYKAWERLAAKFYEKTDEAKQILDKLESALIDFEKQPLMGVNANQISTERIMEFLRTGGKKGGKRFVGNNKDGNWKRPNWKIFRNAFAAWFFGLDQSAVRTYLNRALKQGVTEDNIYQPSFVSPKSSVPRIWSYLLTTPLVAVREPVTLSESDIIIDDLEAAIKTASESAEEGEGN